MCDLNAFFCFNCLMQTLVISSSYHKTTRKFVNNNNLAVFYYIINIAFHNPVSLYRLLDMMHYFKVFGVIDIIYSEIFLHLFNAAGSKGTGFCLFVNDIIAVKTLLFIGKFFIHFYNNGFFKPFCNSVGTFIQVGGFFAAARNNKRSPCFINEYRVNLIDYCKVVSPLNTTRRFNHHIVPKVVKSQFVIGTIGYIGVIRFAFFFGLQTRNNKPYSKSHKTVHFTHPLTVAAGKIIINGYDMNTVACKRIKVSGQSRN